MDGVVLGTLRGPFARVMAGHVLTQSVFCLKLALSHDSQAYIGWSLLCFFFALTQLLGVGLEYWLQRRDIALQFSVE